MNNSYQLISTPRGLGLQDLAHPEWAPVVIDFVHQWQKLKDQQVSRRKDLLSKAVGCAKNKEVHILDATAGLGKDSLKLLYFGAQITALEKNPLVFKLLEDAQKRAINQDAFPELTSALESKFTLYQADHRSWWKNTDQSFNCIYLDPMYPERTKKALPQKAMQVLHQMLGAEKNVPLLVEQALVQCGRVVLKRPPQRVSEGMVPVHRYQGKSVCFDVFLGPSK